MKIAPLLKVRWKKIVLHQQAPEPKKMLETAIRSKTAENFDLRWKKKHEERTGE